MADKALAADNKPKKVELEKGGDYYWCACGRSSDQPFCDGSHKGTGLTPQKFVAAEAEALAGKSVISTNIKDCQGLEADAILLVDLPTLDSDEFASASYVGSTRAHAYLAVFIPESERDAFDQLAIRFGRLSAGIG